MIESGKVQKKNDDEDRAKPTAEKPCGGKEASETAENKARTNGSKTSTNIKHRSRLNFYLLELKFKAYEHKQTKRPTNNKTRKKRKKK